MDESELMGSVQANKDKDSKMVSDQEKIMDEINNQRLEQNTRGENEGYAPEFKTTSTRDNQK